MVGRGCLGNPFLFREIEHYFETGELIAPATAEERSEVCKRHLLLAVEKRESFAEFLSPESILPGTLKTSGAVQK